MPEETWPVTKDDKVQIQELGRKLNEFLNKEFAGKDSVHVKIVVGAFNYIMGLQQQKTKLIGDDFIILDRSIKAAKLENRIEEPFSVEPDLPEPTAAEKRAYLQEQIEALDAEEEIAEASPAPSDSAPVEAIPEPEVAEAPVEKPEVA